MRVSNGLESDVTSDCKIDSAGAGTLSRAWVALGPARLFFHRARSWRSQGNEGSLWGYQSLISADCFAPTASAVRAVFPLTLPESRSEERILAASFALLSLTAPRARAPGGERLSARASGPTAVVVRASAKVNRSRQSRSQNPAHMGSSSCQSIAPFLSQRFNSLR